MVSYITLVHDQTQEIGTGTVTKKRLRIAMGNYGFLIIESVAPSHKHCDYKLPR